MNRFPPGGVLIEKNGIRAGDLTLRVSLVIILKVIVYLLSVLSLLRRNISGSADRRPPRAEPPF
ncbi:MAG TPA: hypothetical protein VH878_00035 [Thermodesulfobacteriota bacterium]